MQLPTLSSMPTLRSRSICNLETYDEYSRKVQFLRQFPHRRNRVRRAGRRQAAQGRGQGRRSSWRSATARSPARRSAMAAGIEAIDAGQTHYCPSLGLPEFREAIAKFVQRRVRHPGDGRERRRRPRGQAVRAVLLRAVPRTRRRRAGLQPALPDVRAEHPAPRRRARVPPAHARRTPSARTSSDVEQFVEDRAARPKAIFLNSPHNPTGGVATERRPARPSPTSSAARTWRSSATSRTATWSGRAGTSRSWPSRG